MTQRKASTTAVLVAGYRARAARAAGAICRDDWASLLAGEEGEALAQQMDRLQPHLEPWIAVRTAFIDARVRVRAGPPPECPQVVILGAGLDTRSARLARSGVRFFEVDRPSSQRDKLRRTAALESYPRDAATYVSCDFEHQDFLARLGEEGFDTRVPALFVWEGVTYYLPEPAVRATLARIASGCHRESVVLFDFVGRKMASGEVRDEADRDTHTRLTSLGEPLRFGTNDILPLLYETGYRRVRVTTFDEAALNLTGTYERARKWRFQYLAEASVAASGEW